MRVCIEFRNNKASKTLVGLSSGACDIVEIGSPLLYFVDPKIDLCSGKYILPIKMPETGNNLDLSDIFACEKCNDVSFFDFHIFDTFSRME
jgi:hypothetical protein